ARAALADALPRLVHVEPARGQRPHAGDHDPSPAVGAHIPNPPSTASTSPVTNPAASETRNRTARATSAGSPSRRSGVWSRIASRAVSGRASVSAVVTYPGATAFTRIPRPPSSLASDFVSPIRPALDA